MKRKIYFNLLFLIISICNVHAQTPQLQLSVNNNTTFVQAFAAASENLPVSRVPYGVLYDKVAGWANLDTWDSNDTTSKSHLLQAWWDLENSRIAPGVVRYDELKNRVADMKSEKRIPLIALNYQFGFIDTLAYTDGRMRVENNELIDAGGASPYLERHVCFAGLGVDAVTVGENYILDSKEDFILNNTSEIITGFTVQNITIGTQFYIAKGQSLSLSFANEGINILKIIVHTNTSAYSIFQQLPVARLAVSPMARVANSESPQIGEDAVHRLLYSDIAFKGYDESMATTSIADFHIYYHYQSSTNPNVTEQKLKKPVIILDGFDPGDKRSYKDIYSNQLKYDSIYFLGEDLRKKGYDVIILNFPVAGGPKYTYEIKQILPLDIEKIDLYPDFPNGIPKINGSIARDGGADYIERNAFLLVKLIQSVNDSLRNNGSNEKLVVVGPSMGGLISRYALAYMEMKEAAGQPNMKHNTKLWLSFDSPHDGANIPLSLQTGPYFFGKVGGNQEAWDSYNNQLRNPAARQMLIEQVNEVNKSSSFFQTFYNKLKNNNGLPGSDGWPQNLKKINLLNGTTNGSKNNIESQLILHIQGRRVFRSLLAEFMAYNLPATGHKEKFFKGVVTKVDLPWYVIVTFPDPYEITNNNTNGCMDVVQGSTFNASAVMEEEFSKAFTTNSLKVEVRQKGLPHSFIPTISALGFKNPNFNWSQPVNNRNLVQTGEIYFDDYYVPPHNQEHVSLTRESVNWLWTQLEPCTPPQNMSISGAESFCGSATFSLSNLPANITVAWSLNIPIFSLSPNGASVTVNTNGQSGAATLTATITNACGSYTVSKYIYSSAQPSSWPISIIRKSTSNYGMQAYEIAYNGIVPYSTEWEWESGTPPTYFEFEATNGMVWSMTPFTPLGKGFGFVYDLNYNPPRSVRIRYKNECGFSDWRTFEVYSRNGGWYYRTSPNPSSSVLSISIDESQIADRSAGTVSRTAEQSIPSFDQVIISDITGNIKLRQNVKSTQNAQIDVSRLPNGIYYLNLYNAGKLIEKKTIQVAK